MTSSQLVSIESFSASSSTVSRIGGRVSLEECSGLHLSRLTTSSHFGVDWSFTFREETVGEGEVAPEEGLEDVGE